MYCVPSLGELVSVEERFRTGLAKTQSAAPCGKVCRLVAVTKWWRFVRRLCRGVFPLMKEQDYSELRNWHGWE